MNYWLIAVPVIGAFIGWIINRTIIRLLFHPREPKKFAGLTIQGIFPKRRPQLARQLGKLVNQEFFPSFNIEQKISDPKNLEKVMPLIENHVDHFLRVKLSEQMPMLSMFIGDKTINSLKTVFMKEIESLFPQVMNQFATDLKNDLDLEQVVTQKLSTFSSDKLEEVLQQSMSKELRYFKIAGTAIGFATGIILVVITVLTS